MERVSWAVVVVESFEEAAEEGGSLRLVVFGGVVVLALQGGGELECDGEVDAGFADGFEVAVELFGSGAVAVAVSCVMLSETGQSWA